VDTHLRTGALLQAVEAFGGIASSRQLMRRGVTRAAIAHATGTGVLRRLRRGVVATPSADPAACLAVQVGGRLCGISAARSYGVWSGFDRRVHVAVLRNAGHVRAEAGVVIHWIECAPAREHWRVRLEDSVRQVLTWCDRETALACLETAIELRGLIPGSFARSAPRVRLLVARSRPGCQSGPESIVRQRLERRGLRLISQAFIAGVGHVDLLIAGVGLVIEVDGLEYHSDPRSFENDRRRDRALVANGYRVMRLSFRQVFAEWPACEAAILSAVALGRNPWDGRGA
jgi:very-short-patch-repair endonuclease